MAPIEQKEINDSDENSINGNRSEKKRCDLSSKLEFGRLDDHQKNQNEKRLKSEEKISLRKFSEKQKGKTLLKNPTGQRKTRKRKKFVVNAANEPKSWKWNDEKFSSRWDSSIETNNWDVKTDQKNNFSSETIGQNCEENEAENFGQEKC